MAGIGPTSGRTDRPLLTRILPSWLMTGRPSLRTSANGCSFTQVSQVSMAAGVADAGTEHSPSYIGTVPGVTPAPANLPMTTGMPPESQSLDPALRAIRH